MEEGGWGGQTEGNNYLVNHLSWVVILQSKYTRTYTHIQWHSYTWTRTRATPATPTLTPLLPLLLTISLFLRLHVRRYRCCCCLAGLPPNWPQCPPCPPTLRFCLLPAREPETERNIWRSHAAVWLTALTFWLFLVHATQVCRLRFWSPECRVHKGDYQIPYVDFLYMVF